MSPERLASRLDLALELLADVVRFETLAVLAVTAGSVADADATVVAASPLSNTVNVVVADPTELLRVSTMLIDRQSRRADP